jgi:hypothetical protein
VNVNDCTAFVAVIFAEFVRDRRGGTVSGAIGDAVQRRGSILDAHLLLLLLLLLLMMMKSLQLHLSVRLGLCPQLLRQSGLLWHWQFRRVVMTGRGAPR